MIITRGELEQIRRDLATLENKRSREVAVLLRSLRTERQTGPARAHAWLGPGLGDHGLQGYGVYAIDGILLQTVQSAAEAIEIIRYAKQNAAMAIAAQFGVVSTGKE